jgi:hypothetical protein
MYLQTVECALLAVLNSGGAEFASFPAAGRRARSVQPRISVYASPALPHDGSLWAGVLK